MTSTWAYPLIMENLRIISITISICYFFGMMYVLRFTCGCDDHAGVDLLIILFWPIAIPIILIKDYFEEKAQNRSNVNSEVKDGM